MKKEFMNTLDHLKSAARFSRAFLVFTLILGLGGLSATAQNSNGNGVREQRELLSSALDAMELGDFETAYRQLHTLTNLGPQDDSVIQLVADVERNLRAEGVDPVRLVSDDAEADEAAPSMNATNGDGIGEADVAEDTPAAGDAPAVSAEPEVAAVETPTSPRQLRRQLNALEPIKSIDAARYRREVEALREKVADDPSLLAIVDEYIQDQEFDALLERQQNVESQAREARRSARSILQNEARADRFDQARQLLQNTRDRLQAEAPGSPLIAGIEDDIRRTHLQEASARLDEGDHERALRAYGRYTENPSQTSSVQDSAAAVKAEIDNPYNIRGAEVSLDWTNKRSRIDTLLRRGRAQFVNGDYQGARATFYEVETLNPTNVEAKAFLLEIAERATRDGFWDREKTRGEMLSQVSDAWRQPRIYGADPEQDLTDFRDELLQKLEAITIPRVTFAGASLSRAVQSLSDMSIEFDTVTEDETQRGVNMVVTQPTDVEISFSVRNLSLARILDIVAQQSGYSWDVVGDVVEFSRAEAVDRRLQRAFIPISRTTLDMIVDFQAAAPGQRDRGTGFDDPFASPSAAPTGPASDERQELLIDFFEASGIPFRNIQGASVIHRGNRLMVNQTARNIEEIRRTLREIDMVEQVEIEAKFMEVIQGDLDQLGFQWNVGARQRNLLNRTASASTVTQFGSGFETGSGGSSFGEFRESVTTRDQTDSPVFDRFGNRQTEARTRAQTPGNVLSSFFEVGDLGDNNLIIEGVGVSRPPIPVSPGRLPSAIDIGGSTPPLFSTLGVIGEYSVELLINALQRRQGTDLLSAPKVTVLSGKEASIVVAQEFIYPTRFGEPQVDAGGGSSTGGTASGGGSVSVAGGVPEDFETRNVGVELTVTPIVEPNEKINLTLDPRVTEFEGFVQYGSPSIAVVGGESPLSVSTPSGYFQPIFAVRSIRTEVTVFDGATVVLGGLTREEIKRFSEKVPFLGDIPLLGRLFRSEGETIQKRNLLIFVTANLISPGGAPTAQRFEGVTPGALFQNPTLVGPGGSMQRSQETVESPGGLGVSGR